MADDVVRKLIQINDTSSWETMAPPSQPMMPLLPQENRRNLWHDVGGHPLVGEADE
jgi:hypothetical protein